MDSTPPPSTLSRHSPAESADSPLDRMARNIIFNMERREQGEQQVEDHSNLDNDDDEEKTSMIPDKSGRLDDLEGSPLPLLQFHPSTSAFTHPHSSLSTSRRRSYLVSSIFGFFGGLKRLLDRNPATVISGRYTIHLRQGLLLIVLLVSLTMFWLLASGTNTSSHFLEMSGEDLGQSSNNAQRRHRDRVDGSPQSNLLAGKNLAMPVVGSDHSSSSTDNFLYPAFVPSTDEGENTVKAKDRFERVRGRGAHSDLPKIQFVFPRETDKQRSVREQRRLAVRAGFQHTWAGYKKYAWGHDEVKPVSGGFRDSFNGWGATMIDSLDTMVIMELNREFDEALEWVKTQFSMTREATVKVQFFETVIRYLGGFLSSYELTGERVLLDKAKELGGYLLNAFEDGSNYHRTFPAGRVAVAKEETSTGDTKNGYILAEIGTIQVEFTKLSKLTGDPIFEEKARKVFDRLISQKQQLPGLLPSLVQDIQNHQYESYEASMGGMIDSYYEYLLKEWILLDGEEDSEGYRSAFEQAMDSVHKYMVSTPSDGSEDYAIIGKVTTSSKSINPDMEHLACFISGTLAMSSKYFNRPQDLILAKKVAEACYQTYRRSKTGLSPESFKFRSVEGSDGKVFKVEEETFYDRDQSQKHYILRPETIESLWILYRLTGESKYQEQAWEIFQSLERSCRTNIAYSGLNDVNEGHFFDDRMESFFMAETMKYLYLMFSTPDVISLDDFVLNTEAHPVLRT